MHFKLSSGNWRTFCLGLNVLRSKKTLKLQITVPSTGYVLLTKDQYCGQRYHIMTSVIVYSMLDLPQGPRLEWCAESHCPQSGFLSQQTSSSVSQRARVTCGLGEHLDEPVGIIIDWCIVLNLVFALRWRHIGRDGVSNHQPNDCLLNRLFRSRSKKTSKLRVTGLCAGNSQGSGEFSHKWPVTRKCFHFMTSSWTQQALYDNPQEVDISFEKRNLQWIS